MPDTTFAGPSTTITYSVPGGAPGVTASTGEQGSSGVADRVPDRVTVAAIAGVIVVAASGCVMMLGAGSGAGDVAGLGVRIAVLAGLAVVVVAVIVWLAVRRARGVRALELAATRWRDQPAGMPVPDLESLPGELSPLASVFESLRVRVASQVKDAAKKTRNLEALIDAIDEPILATDNQDRVLLCNRSAERLLDPAGVGGETGEKPAGVSVLLGRDIHDLFTQEAILALHGAARAGQTRRQRVRVTTPLGPRVFQVTASPVPMAWGEGVFGVVLALRDVTEQEQAVQVQTDFVANASHELRTPVASIRGAAETMQSALDDPEMSTKLCGMILSNAIRLEEMLRDLLDLSRLESPHVSVEKSPVDVWKIRDDIAGLSHDHCAERSLTLSFEIDPRLQHMRSDRKLVMLMLRNLVENATKFAHERTSIRVVGTIIDTPAKLGGNNAVVRFTVIDKGIGIPLAAQDRVFERYYQADPGRGSHLKGWRRGTGLGLAIVKHAAQALGGKASLTSVWGQGTSVWVEFPVELER